MIYHVIISTCKQKKVKIANEIMLILWFSQIALILFSLSKQMNADNVEGVNNENDDIEVDHISYMRAVYRSPLKYLDTNVPSPRFQKTQSSIDYQILDYDQQVDHFSFTNADMFKMRYILSVKHWDKNGGPIFFYCGNEGDITWFANNTGAVWEWAPEFKAMVIFAEHRYYGTSLPYGNESYSDNKRLGYLTSSQALADYASLLQHIKSTMAGAADSPVIAFGGSYGGMLAAWFRMKYPNVIEGSLAASAPIWMFGDLTPCDAFYKTVTRDFEKGGINCAENIKNSWSILKNFSTTESGLQFISKTFKLCDALNNTEDFKVLHDWLYNTYGNLAMVDYPYAASFLEPLPARPIEEVCRQLRADPANMSPSATILAVAEAVMIYYNYTGTHSCLSVKQQATGDLGDKGWEYQACTEMVMPICSTGVDDMFQNIPFNLEAFSEGCKKQWNVEPRPDWVITEYGGKNIRDVTNIIFSNGDLDPWSGGGVLEDLSPTLVALMIEGGAHHLDLRASQPEDPPSVRRVRQREKEIIAGWIKNYHGNQKSNFQDASIYQIPILGHALVKTSSWIQSTTLTLSGLIILLSLASLALLLFSTRRVRKQGVHYISRIQSNFDTAKPHCVHVNSSSNNCEKRPLLMENI